MHNNVLTIEEIKQRSMICPQNNIQYEPSLSSLLEDLHQVAAFKKHREKSGPNVSSNNNVFLGQPSNQREM